MSCTSRSINPPKRGRFFPGSTAATSGWVLTFIPEELGEPRIVPGFSALRRPGPDTKDDPEGPVPLPPLELLLLFPPTLPPLPDPPALALALALGLALPLPLPLLDLPLAGAGGTRPGGRSRSHMRGSIPFCW